MEILSRYNDICRVCCSADNRNQMAALFQTTVNDGIINLAEMFTVCTAIILKPNDGLPQLICTICLSKLIAAYEFQMQCISTDNHIRNEILAIISNEETKNTTDSLKQRSISLVKEENHYATIESEKFDNLAVDSVVNETITTQNHTNVVNNDEVDSMLPPQNQSSPSISLLTIKKQNENETDYEDNYYLPLKQKSSSNENINTTQETPKIKIKQKTLSHECKICGKMFDKPYRLMRHSNVHNINGKPYECDICKIRFVTESRLIRHKIKHTDLLQQHKLTDNNAEQFSCTQCNREFTKHALSSHLKIHHRKSGNDSDADNKEYLCEHCPKKFLKLNLLTRHLKIHDEIKGNKCNICDRTFALGGQLIDHMNRHKGIKPHICPICNKGNQVFICNIMKKIL